MINDKNLLFDGESKNVFITALCRPPIAILISPFIAFVVSKTRTTSVSMLIYKHSCIDTAIGIILL